jgi:hypothetical protein
MEQAFEIIKIIITWYNIKVNQTKFIFKFVLQVNCKANFKKENPIKQMIFLYYLISPRFDVLFFLESLRTVEIPKRIR